LTEYTSVLQCEQHLVSDISDPNAGDWIVSYTKHSFARLCDYFALQIHIGNIPFPAHCAPFSSIRIDLDGYEDTVVGWALRVPQEINGRTWEALNDHMTQSQKLEVERLLANALRGCLAPRNGCYHMLYQARALGPLSAHEIIELTSKAEHLETQPV
jgi:hypothetical protein